MLSLSLVVHCLLISKTHTKYMYFAVQVFVSSAQVYQTLLYSTPNPDRDTLLPAAAAASPSAAAVAAAAGGGGGTGSVGMYGSTDDIAEPAAASALLSVTRCTACGTVMLGACIMSGYCSCGSCGAGYCGDATTTTCLNTGWPYALAHMVAVSPCIGTTASAYGEVLGGDTTAAAVSSIEEAAPCEAMLRRRWKNPAIAMARQTVMPIRRAAPIAIGMPSTTPKRVLGD
jgi:hypothetical protein